MYRFRREDTNEIISVDFETMMTQDAAGFVTLDGGVRARRVNDFVRPDRTIEPNNAPMPPPVSDAMGFPMSQLTEFEEDRTRNAFHGVEFRPDPTCPAEFVQVHFASHAERDRYMRHRGMVDRNRTAGGALSKQDLEAAAEFAKNLGK